MALESPVPLPNLFGRSVFDLSRYDDVLLHSSIHRTAISKMVEKLNDSSVIGTMICNLTPDTEERPMESIYEYAVYVPASDDNPASVVVPITSVVAPNEATVRVIAARAIPEGVDLAKAKIVVRPFA